MVHTGGKREKKGFDWALCQGGKGVHVLPEEAGNLSQTLKDEQGV